MASQGRNGAPSSATSYDEVPYPSYSFPVTHPNRLAALGRLFGMTPTRPSRARVLELGCADGTNILPMAEQAPQAEFLGVDSSAVQIATGQRAQGAVGLKNVELRCQDILEFPATAGKFDYIIVHGLFSWVPEPVREKILQICADHLSENGIAYVSYNTLPGWNMRRSLRDMVRFHTAGIADPKIKAQQIRAFVAFLAESVPTEDNAHALFLKDELEGLKGRMDAYLIHELLEEENTPFYFHDFAGRAARHGLQYLGETSLAQMLAANLPVKIRDTLAQISTSVIAQEQYMDFVRNRAFRSTLLCRSSVALNRQISPEVMRLFSFLVRFKSRSGPSDLRPNVPVCYLTLSDQAVTMTEPLVKAVFDVLLEARPSVIPFQTLMERTNERLADAHSANNPSDAIKLGTLLNLYSKGLLEIYAEPIILRTSVAEKPEMSRLARYQALHSRVITSQLHEGIGPDIVGRLVVEACDGTRTPAQIVDELISRAHEGKFSVRERDQPVTTDERLRSLLTPQVEALLNSMAQGGCFAA